jgi:signal transduction histidine kinase
MISEINYADDVEVRSLSDTVQYVAKKYATKLNSFNFDVGIGVRNYNLLDPRNKLISIIFENALENSIQYARYNSDKTISLKINEKKNNLIVSIGDNGIGIPKEMLPKVTDMYFRGNENSTGNGLGLYVAYLAAKKLNGTLTVDSKLGEYTFVQVEFPIFSNPELTL